VSSKEPTLREVLSVLPAGKRKGKYECPVCLEWHLVISVEKGKVLVNCKTRGCPDGAAWNRIKEKLSKLNKVRSNGSPKKREDRPGFTLADYCKLKGLSWLEMLAFEAYEITYYDKKPAVAFPYGIRIDGSWEYTGIKLRLSADDSYHPKFLWAVGEGNDWMGDSPRWRAAGTPPAARP